MRTTNGLVFMGVMLAASLVAPSCARAQQGYVGIDRQLTHEQLREVGLTPAQLALLDRYLAEAHARTAAALPVDAPARRGPKGYIGLDDKPMQGRLIGTVEGWAPDTVFVFADGQQWKVLKGSARLGAPLRDPDVTLVPGIAGRWFLQVDPDLPKARVYRID